MIIWITTTDSMRVSGKLQGPRTEKIFNYGIHLSKGGQVGWYCRNRVWLFKFWVDDSLLLWNSKNVVDYCKLFWILKYFLHTYIYRICLPKTTWSRFVLKHLCMYHEFSKNKINSSKNNVSKNWKPWSRFLKDITIRSVWRAQ